MPTPNKGPRMGGSPAHERLMLSNLATQLFQHGRITTTEAKAKRLRPYAEHLITFGKRGDLHARRQVLKRLNDKSVVHTLFAEIGPRYVDRPGGYTRILKLGNRKGDNAPMAIIELVEALTVQQSAVGEAERARGTQVAPRKAPTGATRESAEALKGQSPTAAAVAAEPAAEETAVDDAALDTTEDPTADTMSDETTADPAAVETVEVPAEDAPLETTSAEATAVTADQAAAPEADAAEAAADTPAPDEDAK